MIGITCIVFGIVIMLVEAVYVVFPTLFTIWYKEAIETDTRVRILATGFLALGAILIWAGSTEQHNLTYALIVFGMFSLCASGWMMLVPADYRFLVDMMMPSEPCLLLSIWRVMAFGGVLFGGVAAYYGMIVIS